MKKEMIKQFIEASILRSKSDIMKNGTHSTTLYVLTKKDGEYSVHEKTIDRLVESFDSVQKIVKSMIDIQFMFHELKQNGHEMIHMVHTEMTNIEKDDDGNILQNDGESLLVYDKDFKTNECSIKVFLIKREDAFVKDDGELALGKASFMEI